MWHTTGTERAVRRTVAMAGLLSIAMSARAGLSVGDVLPPLKAADFEGSLPDLTAKVVLLDFWASWCGPCRKSFPELDKLAARHRDKGLVILGVNQDEKPKDMQKFLDRLPVSFPVVFDKAHRLASAIGVPAMPTSVLVGRDGRIALIHAGFQGDEDIRTLEQAILKLVGPAADAKAAAKPQGG